MENNQSLQQSTATDSSHYEKIVTLLEEQSQRTNEVYETSQVQAATLLFILVTILSVVVGKLFMAIFKILK